MEGRKIEATEDLGVFKVRPEHVSDMPPLTSAKIPPPMSGRKKSGRYAMPFDSTKPSGSYSNLIPSESKNTAHLASSLLR